MIEKNNNIKSCPNAETMKVITEIPIPREGEKLSSGGLRKDGKIVAQYTNPEPYVEPSPSPAIQKSAPDFHAQAKAQMNALVLDVGMDLLYHLWYNHRDQITGHIYAFLGKVVISASNAIAPTCTHTEQPQIMDAPHAEIIDTESASNATIDDNSDTTISDTAPDTCAKVINFPDREAI